MKKKLIVAGVLALVFVLLLASLPACAPAAPEVKTVKMASLLSLSGPVAGWGVPLDDGCRWAADEINEQGGLEIGKDRYMVDLRSFDDEYSGSVTATMAAMIVDEGIHYVYGPLSYDGERSGAPIFEAGKVFNGGMSSAEHLTETIPLGYKYFWSPSYPNRFYFGNMLDMAVEYNPGVKTIIQINPDDDFGHLAAEEIIKSCTITEYKLKVYIMHREPPISTLSWPRLWKRTLTFSSLPIAGPATRLWRLSRSGSWGTQAKSGETLAHGTSWLILPVWKR